ncbi:[protein-PII] uridylyltransferase family protein, partial [Shewanella sp. 0m-11]
LNVEAGMFDLKQSSGGIADIEFIAQYLVLAHSHKHKALSFWSDNVRIFAELAELELIPFESAQALTQAYCHLRDESHRLTLQQKKSVLPIEAIKSQTDRVVEIYRQILGE